MTKLNVIRTRGVADMLVHIKSAEASDGQIHALIALTPVHLESRKGRPQNRSVRDGLSRKSNSGSPACI